MFSCFHFHSSVDNQQHLITSLACYEVAQKSKWGVWPEHCTLLNQQNTYISLYTGLMTVDMHYLELFFCSSDCPRSVAKLFWAVLHMLCSPLLGLPTGHQTPFSYLIQELKAHGTDGS